MSRGVTALAFALVASASVMLGALALGGGRFAVATRPGERSSEAGNTSFAEVVERLNPAVVHITVTDPTLQDPHAGLPGAPLVSPTPRRGEGSGFLVDADGYILTNQHLVGAGTSRIRVRLADKREMAATLVGSDAHTDLALIKIKGQGFPFIPFGDSDRLRVGEWVCAIGNPYRFDHSVTVGVVSSKGRKIWDASFDAYIQTDAAINPGNSGGPLIDAAGRAIGISAAVSLEGQGIGFAVPINVARDIMEQLRSHGHVSRGYLGVQLQELDPDLQRLVRAPSARGALVLEVLPGNAGAAAGLRRYDVITSVSGQDVSDGDQLVRAISAKRPGTDVTLSVLRDGQPLSLQTRLDERAAGEDADEAAEPAASVPPSGDALGLSVEALDAKTRAALELPGDRQGVVVKATGGLSPGLEALLPGDLVMEVNRQPTPDTAAYQRIVSGLPRGGVAYLLVYRPRARASLLTRLEVE
jgi:serine protease Do